MKTYTLFTENENKQFLRNLTLFNFTPFDYNIRDLFENCYFYEKFVFLNKMRRTFKNAEYLAIKNNNTGKIVYREKLSNIIVKYHFMHNIYWTIEQLRHKNIKEVPNLLSIVEDPYFKELMNKYEYLRLLINAFYIDYADEINNLQEFKEAA